MQWWTQQVQEAHREARREAGLGDKKLTTLGLLKYFNHPYVEYFECQYLLFIRRCLVDDWPLIQGGVGPAARYLWSRIVVTLELDRKATVDLMLLAHSGEVGRAEANEVLWNLLACWALKDGYEDLSHLVSKQVSVARRNLDRPPARHSDRAWWSWRLYREPRNPAFGPLAARNKVVNLRQRILQPPPHCWAAWDVPWAVDQ